MANEILLTDKAATQVKKIQAKEMKPDSLLKVSVVGGGCSGMSYNLDFITKEEVKESDKKIEFDNVTIVVDAKSILFLKGMTLDFTDGLNGQGFVFTNPNAKQTCGCGSSFAV